MHAKALLISFGNVAQGFISSLANKSAYIKETYGLDLMIVGAVEVARDGK